MEIKKSNIFEVYEAQKGKRKSIFTKSRYKDQVYGEIVVKKGQDYYHEWNPEKSKLAAAIKKGCLNIFIRNGDKILYLGASYGTTVSHVSDIVGKEGFVFALDFAPRVMRDLVLFSEKRDNIAPIMADANRPESYSERIVEPDVIFMDIAQKNQVDIFLKNVDMFLKKDGYALFAVKSRSIDVTKKPKEIFKEVRQELEKKLVIVDSRTLDPFEKDHCMFICKKK